MPLITGDSNSSITVNNSGLLRKGNDSNVLYNFFSWTFTPAGATGRNGPTLTQCQTAYSSSTFASNSSYFNVVSGIQKWTVPKTGFYRIQAAGAPGGKASDGFAGQTTQGLGGNGIIISAQFYLVVSDILYILVGQHGQDSPTGGTGGSTLEGGNGFNSDTDAGGGGATYVAKQVASSTQSQYLLAPAGAYVIPLIVAGGGAGASSDGNGGAGIFQSQPYFNPTQADQWGYGTGGGWNWYPTDVTCGASGITTRINQGIAGGNPGATSTYGIRGYPRPGAHFLAGGQGGNTPATTAIEGQGGFGGGGGAVDEGGSGGGGWFGGVNADNTNPNTGGGTSYFSPDATNISNDGSVAAAATGAGIYTTNDGYCKITFLGSSY